MGKDEILATLVIAGLASVAAGVAIVALRRLRSRPPTFVRNDIFGALVVSGGVLGATLLLMVLIGLLGVFGPVWWAVAAFVVIETWRKHRAARQYGLLWLLTVSAERSMPLGPAVEAFAREGGAMWRHRVRRLAEMLEEGMPLPDALEHCPKLLPPHALPMVRVGYQSGALASALRQATKIYNLHEPIWSALNGKLAYLLLLPVFGAAILVFVMFKIVPAFEKIFADFGTVLPPITRSLIRVAGWMANYPILLAPFDLLVLALLVYAPLRYLGWIRWNLPGLGRLVRRLESAQILDALRVVAERERPLSEGIEALAESYPRADIRRRLRRAVAEMQSGVDWGQSLLRQGLLRPNELALLQAAQRAGNLPWALAEMADSGRRRLALHVQAFAQMLFPPIVILMGLFVMFIVVALFLPLVVLIEKLT